ncbi:MAG: hypothetical protein U1F36_17895 [Planctomycetota bacterium]
MTTRATDPAPLSVGASPVMRECPTLSGDTRALITHRIACASCMQRQREHYHKCHRCVYQGKPADFVAEAPATLGRAEDNGLPTGFVDLSAVPSGS